jgi:hypothetical protein
MAVAGLYPVFETCDGTICRSIVKPIPVALRKSTKIDHSGRDESSEVRDEALVLVRRVGGADGVDQQVVELL